MATVARPGASFLDFMLCAAPIRAGRPSSGAHHRFRRFGARPSVSAMLLGILHMLLGERPFWSRVRRDQPGAEETWQSLKKTVSVDDLSRGRMDGGRLDLVLVRFPVKLAADHPVLKSAQFLAVAPSIGLACNFRAVCLAIPCACPRLFSTIFGVRQRPGTKIGQCLAGFRVYPCGYHVVVLPFPSLNSGRLHCRPYYLVVLASIFPLVPSPLRFYFIPHSRAAVPPLVWN